MRTLRLVGSAGACLAATAALAYPNFTPVMTKAYKIPAGSALAKSGCAACHVGATPKLNAYGVDMKKVLAKAKTKALTPALLKKLDKLDSDKDGVKNLAEFKKGTLPGDKKSK